jgi:mannitol/fructose-specific phosphotransferase system IIA component (Ntr-type)
MRLSDFFVCTAVLDGGPGLGKRELIDSLLGRLAEAGHLPGEAVPGVSAAILARERLASTGIGRGVAIPHARHPEVPHALGVLAVARRGVEFDSLDGEPVDLIALCLWPPDEPGRHLGPGLRLLGGLIRRLPDQEFFGGLRRAGSAEELAALVEAADRGVPAEWGGMTERDWLGCAEPGRMLDCLRAVPAQHRGRPSPRKLRLFACACVRSAWNRLADGGYRALVEVAERFADGQAREGELADARAAVRQAHGRPPGPLHQAAFAAAGPDAAAAAEAAAALVPFQGDAGRAAADLLREVIGPLPFRLVALPPPWLAWEGGTVARLAEAVYEARRWPDLPVLGDALEDAGCRDAEILDHLRGAGPHARGCWALDLLLRRPGPR